MVTSTAGSITGPQDPRDVEQRVKKKLSQHAETLSEEAIYLEEAYRILNDALS